MLRCNFVSALFSLVRSYLSLVCYSCLCDCPISLYLVFSLSQHSLLILEHQIMPPNLHLNA